MEIHLILKLIRCYRFQYTWSNMNKFDLNNDGTLNKIEWRSNQLLIYFSHKHHNCKCLCRTRQVDKLFATNLAVNSRKMYCARRAVQRERAMHDCIQPMDLATQRYPIASTCRKWND